MKPRELAWDIFGGARGWDQHDKELGLVTWSIDVDPAATKTAKANHADGFGPAIEKDVRELQINPYAHDPVTLLKGSPPCTEFTVAGSGDGRAMLKELCHAVTMMPSFGGVPRWAQDKEAGLVLEPLRLIIQAHDAGRPFRAVVLEQTREVLPIWHAYADVLESMGYSVDTGLLHAEQYGVPQSRTRSALVARLDGPVSLPKPTHSRYHVMDPDRLDDELLPWVPMRQALYSQHHGVLLRSNYGTGGNAAKRGERHIGRPAPTITRKYNRNKWLDNQWVECGRMTDAEASALQTFSWGHKWCGSPTEVQLQIGNAIPPLLAKAILQQVL